MFSYTIREKLLIAFVLLLSAVGAFSHPVNELVGYLHFADQREALGIPRVFDVLSNLPFAFAGLLGLYLLSRSSNQNTLLIKPFAIVFFFGLVVTSIGSVWFHLQPFESGRLAADRLGMLVAFTGLIGCVSALKISLRAGYALAGFIAIAGVVSILHGNISGNALPWALLQFGGLAVVMCCAMLKNSASQSTLNICWIVAVYAAAKALEVADHPVFDWTNQLISGHSLKHIVASLAAWPVIAMICRPSPR
jgi:hypothetical protein